ncbi:hypothetical protein DYB32_002925 [Aphanomyces invadans]|uniref:P-type ATPase C-terminal domain-containing protein n=1 Tax=Aphanomyces invadans TaxID=157072 RepID=A0A3R6VPS9_9STRA|nr:hypothetical protein DYB32_002925 [Aphanomyces invadans]
MQAVNSSDYAIAQFYFLEKLLLHHGRLNYVRMSKLVGYMFYKNIMMALAQYFYLYTTGSSGQKAYSEIAFQAYNLAFTSMPIVALGVFDFDVPWAVGQRFPALYKPGITGALFNTTVFFKWIAAAIFESAVIFIATVYAYNQLEQGVGNGDLQQYGILLFTLVVFVCNFKKYVLGELDVQQTAGRDIEADRRQHDDTYREVPGHFRNSRHSNSSSHSVSRKNSGFAFSTDPRSSMAEGIMITSTMDSRASAMRTAESRVRITRLEQRSSDYALTRDDKQPSGYFI